MVLKETKIPWEDFDKLKIVKKLRQLVEETWQVQLNFVDTKGYVRGVPPGKFFNPIHKICKKLSESEKGFQGCIKIARDATQLQDADFHERHCHAGFSTLYVPIRVKGKNLGYILCDGFLERESSELQKQSIKDTLSHLFPSDKDLQTYVEKLPILSRQEVDFLIRLLKTIVEEIVGTQGELWEKNQEVDQLKTELKERFDFGQLVGKSEAMQSLYSMVERIKDAPTTVLIQGENGTGKEIIAKALHYNSVRKEKAFVAINCGAFNENLLESELFGHVKGAFTGAVKDKAGLFEAANEGTLLLDEVAEMSLSMQVKFLRVLQEGTFLPVGSTKVARSNARVICATNKDLEKMVEEGTFRKDLFFRLNVINLYIPPLKERVEDIPLLVEHFSQRFAQRMNVQKKDTTEPCLKRLLSYEWPGNVRELENEMERLYVLSGEDKKLEESNLSDRLFKEKIASLDLKRDGNLKELLVQVEIEVIREGLERTHWNKSQLAKELGISRAGLLIKIEKYGLDKKAG